MESRHTECSTLFYYDSLAAMLTFSYFFSNCDQFSSCYYCIHRARDDRSTLLSFAKFFFAVASHQYPLIIIISGHYYFILLYDQHK